MNIIKFIKLKKILLASISLGLIYYIFIPFRGYDLSIVISYLFYVKPLLGQKYINEIAYLIIILLFYLLIISNILNSFKDVNLYLISRGKHIKYILILITPIFINTVVFTIMLFMMITSFGNNVIFDIYLIYVFLHVMLSLLTVGFTMAIITFYFKVSTAAVTTVFIYCLLIMFKVTLFSYPQNEHKIYVYFSENTDVHNMLQLLGNDIIHVPIIFTNLGVMTICIILIYATLKYKKC